MFPRLQPPRSRRLPQKLHLNTQVVMDEPKQQVETQFTADVMASMYPAEYRGTPSSSSSGSGSGNIGGSVGGHVGGSNGGSGNGGHGGAGPVVGAGAGNGITHSGLAGAGASTGRSSRSSSGTRTDSELGSLVNHGGFGSSGAGAPADGERQTAGMSAQDWNAAFTSKEIEEVREIGEGSGGMVRLCRLRPGVARPYARHAAEIGVFALKEIPANPDPNLRKQILRELQFNRSCASPFIVNYYGAFLVEEVGQIFIAMEYCDGGSLDAILRRVTAKQARIGERVLACVASSVLGGITYLYSQHIIHRDIKPQNILLTSRGEVKLCDFGVSGEVVDSLVTTFTGTSYYMAPERIRGQPYTVTSDVWSLGLTLMELATNRFPFETSRSLTPIELLTQIVNFPAPELQDEPDIKWSASLHHFMKCCLEKDSAKRPPPQKLLSHPWIRGHKKKPFDMQTFVREVWA